MTKEITNTQDIIDVRDIIEQVEALESLLNTADKDNTTDLFEDEQEELDNLTALLEELEGQGGDEEWRGDWYPITLIRYSYFETYAQELADDIGAIDNNASWPMNCIDWEKAARELEMDYTYIDFNGVTYLFR